ncbi:DUF397 domain-containing protein [Streptomyces sp. 4F14]|uniref:DUF397 domain-containing protein n=1 Tax=Streptomyces sp. 4F14 TaxID=3394380 RepID=UPI003A86B29D
MINGSKLPVGWRKSSYSSTNGGNCLEVGEGVSGAVPVRDSKVPNVHLHLTPRAFAGLVEFARSAAV